VFVYFRINREPDERLEWSVSRLRDANQPVIILEMEDRMDLAQEFFRWEVAVAAAGSILGINPFDQPNVQESKDNTNAILKIVSERGSLPEEKPFLVEESLSLYGGFEGSDIKTSFSNFLSQVAPGDYVAVLAYLTEEAAVENGLRSLCRDLQEKFHVATTLGYGPRYLHSTGQYHKGGSNTGLFIELTCDEDGDLTIPGSPYGFSTFRRAQAQGDFEALQKHGRRIIRVDLGGDAGNGIVRLREAVREALTRG
jgi:hypothetical protein